ncbi:MAG: hypothetical protein B6229_10665 [Spirochaetaceae bacterium 4572_7]|nr:MAG: hypothetical protein B6229_10665 [Spirochaetaceae bacterium 4572_7]
MKSRSIFRTFFSIFLLILLLSIGATAIYSITTFNNFIYKTEMSNLEEKGKILQSLFPISSYNNKILMDKFADSSKDHLTRITIIDITGQVISDSIKDASLMNNHLDRAEIKSVIGGNSRVVLRYSDTLSQKMIYYACPLLDEGKLIGFLRVATSVEFFKHRVRVVYITIIIISLIILLISIAIFYMLAMKFSQTINSIKKVANYYAKGDFNYSLTEDGTKEIASLSRSINNMGLLLQKRIFTINKQKNRYKSMLESMTEPVIRLNNFHIIEEMNSSAETLFNKHKLSAKGMGLLELTLNTKLYDFANKTLNGDSLQEDVLTFGQDMEITLQVHGSVLYDAEGNRIGVLLVMNDITELVRLERMRKEFVANVSHELRTPITTIQGYVETLMDNEVSKEQLNKILKVLSNHTIRINNIIEDLLVLAGLDRGGDSFNMENFPAANLVSSAVNAVLVKAEKSGIEIVIEKSPNFNILAHPVLAEQALSNLIINAVKYSTLGTIVSVRTYIRNNQIVLEVEDRGPGISNTDCLKIFDRFYRVDKARSRNQGGTGLGLSIVRRIMGLHGGSVEVDSVLGQGSIFRLIFSS